jgi:peptide/nickel transport system permease protein
MNQTAEVATVTGENIRKSSALGTFLKRLVKEKPLGTVGGILVLILLLAGIFADVIAPYEYADVHPVDRLLPPSSTYILGTDGAGRDMFSRIVYGARISMIVGLSATALYTVVSTAIGLTSGYIGGKFDIILQRFVDAWLCFPGMVIYLIVMNLIGAGMLQIILVLGIGSGIGGSRGARAWAFWIKEIAYMDAARAIGASTLRIVLRHMLPNVLPMVIVSFSMAIGGIILAEASLSFLGFGIPPPYPSWGQMISGQSRAIMERAPWVPLWPGVAITLTIWGMNMFGDAVRDLIDPRLRGGIGGLGSYGSKKAAKVLKKRDAMITKTRRGTGRG